VLLELLSLRWVFFAIVIDSIPAFGINYVWYKRAKRAYPHQKQRGS
jgi:Na+-driven multidrug efflux pump